MAPRQNPYSRAATNMLRMRLNRDESGLVVAKWGEGGGGTVRQDTKDAHGCFKLMLPFRAPTGSTENVHVNLLQQTHHKSIDLR